MVVGYQRHPAEVVNKKDADDQYLGYVYNEEQGPYDSENVLVDSVGSLGGRGDHPGGQSNGHQPVKGIGHGAHGGGPALCQGAYRLKGVPIQKHDKYNGEKQAHEFTLVIRALCLSGKERVKIEIPANSDQQGSFLMVTNPYKCHRGRIGCIRSIKVGRFLDEPAGIKDRQTNKKKVHSNKISFLG